MKSLALHLITILLLLASLQINADKDPTHLRFGASAQLTHSTTTTTPTTISTTVQTPLHWAPTKRTVISGHTTANTHTSTTPTISKTTITTTITSSKRNNNRGRHRAESSITTTPVVTITTTRSRRRLARVMAEANDSKNNNTNKENKNNNNFNIKQEHEKSRGSRRHTTTRLAHNASDKTQTEIARSANEASSVRQNRSLQSETTVNHNGNDVSAYKQRHLKRQQPNIRNTPVNYNNNDKFERDHQLTETVDPEIKVQSNIPLNDDNSAQRSQTKTLKAPRMIARLVAGHIHNSEGRSRYEVSSVTMNSTVTNSSTTIKPTAIYFRPKQPLLSSSYRKARPKGEHLTTTSRPYILSTLTSFIDEDRDDDEALLEDPGDFDNWDNGILRLSAGSGKESATKSKKHKEDSKKTLSDQVRDGKYGLIEKELFRKEPKRPGILSYAFNKEVPIDNEHNFGGLNEEDIWLAEDHLLVIKGGSLNENEPNEPWPPIDDYDAPPRQIKIPPNPKVPPPFPVQLEENGPIQFIGNSKLTVVYPTTNETSSVYTTVTKINDTSAENYGDNEKNLITRPGTSKDAEPGEPGYIYPAPYPPWLYHNQTFVNPFLSHARPITFPGLGPFPLGRNNTLAKLNGTEPFDEDDPSLYYPPAYTFVYKNNYTNSVPAGPLVPGIVLPPPPDHFSRLEKQEKLTTSTTTSTVFPIRHRIYPSTSSTTSTTTPTTTSTTTTTTTIPPTTTTTTTTESPFHHAITKISQYTPKTIIITPAPPVSTTKLSTASSPALGPSTIKSTPYAEPKPIPVTATIPIYPVNSLPTIRQNVLTFVPTTGSPPTVNTLSKSNPIYYEYFEAKRQQGASNVIDDFLSSTSTSKPSPAAPKPIKIYATSKRPYKTTGSRGNYLQAPNQRPYVPQKVVYITPKPPSAPIFKQRPIENFEREVQALRQTLRYYQNQQLRDNSIPRTSKAKTIYEYNFDATKNGQTVTKNVEDIPSSFQPPDQFDEEPFKPMVTYSPPIDDENSFRAIGYEKSEKQKLKSQNKYQSSTTLVPVQNEAIEYVLPQSRSKKLRLSAKYYAEPYGPQAREQDFGDEYQTTQRTILTTQPTWLSLPMEKIPTSNKVKQQGSMHRQSELLQIPPPSIAVKNPSFSGYYYRPVNQPPMRQNNRFYDEPFHNSLRKIVNYRPQPVWSLENDTYVNYLPNRPAINPDSEYIDPYVISGYATAQRQGLAPPPLSHQSQYYIPPHRVQSQHRQVEQIPLHRDILVNYRQPLPPINPDSEYIPQQRNQQQQIYRPQTVFRLSPPAADQSNIFYITPKYRRSNGSPINQNDYNVNEGSSMVMENNGK